MAAHFGHRHLRIELHHGVPDFGSHPLGAPRPGSHHRRHVPQRLTHLQAGAGRQRKVQGLDGRMIQTVGPHISRHCRDLKGGRGVCSHSFAERVLPGPQASGECLAHYRGGGTSVQPIRCLSPQGNSQGAEVAGPDQEQGAAEGLLSRREGAVLDVNGGAAVEPGEGKSRGEAGRLHTGEGFELGRELPVEGVRRLEGLVARLGQHDMERQHAPHREAGAHRGQIVEASQQQAGGRQENQRQRDLGDH